MKKNLKLLLCSSSCLALTYAIGQPSIQWQKPLGGTLGDGGYCIQQSSDGGYIGAGYSFSNDGDVTGHHGSDTLSDCWVFKLDVTGNLQWQKSLGGTSEEYPMSIQQTMDGGYVMEGYSKSTNGNVTGNHGNFDYWVVKMDSSGNLQWQKCLGGSQDDYAYSIQQTSDGGYITSGASISNDGNVSGNHGNTDCWVVKLNSIGNIEWQKSLGGSGYEGGRSIRETYERGYIIAAFSNSNDGDVTGHHGSNSTTDCWVVKLDSLGSLQWQKSLGGSQSEVGFAIQQTIDRGYIVAGHAVSTDGDVTGNHGNPDYWVVKLDSSGNLQWQKCLGGTNNEEAYSIYQTSDGGYIVGGYSYSNNGDISGHHGTMTYTDCWVVKLSATGSMIWEKSLGGTNNDRGYSIQQAFDDGYIVSGYTNSNDGDVTGNHGYSDCWVVKLDSETGVEELGEVYVTVYPNPIYSNALITFTYPSTSSKRNHHLFHSWKRNSTLCIARMEQYANGEAAADGRRCVCGEDDFRIGRAGF
jgi:hypothetical protein